MNDYAITTQSALRAAFWQGMPQVWSKYRGKPQNDWPADLRMEFVDFVDFLARQGDIPESLASSVTGG
jgi:hypothetical protein